MRWAKVALVVSLLGNLALAAAFHWQREAWLGARLDHLVFRSKVERAAAEVDRQLAACYTSAAITPQRSLAEESLIRTLNQLAVRDLAFGR